MVPVLESLNRGGGGGKTGLYFFDMNPDFDFTENARCLLARYDLGVNNHKGVNSGIFVEENFPGAVRFIDKNGVLRICISIYAVLPEMGSTCFER